MSGVPTVAGFTQLFVLIALLTACRTTSEPAAFHEPPAEVAAFMSVSTGYVCTPREGKTTCWCEKAEPSGSARSCDGLDKMCKKFGTKKKCDAVDISCSCTFKL